MEGHEFVWCDAMRGLHFLRPPFTQSKLVRCVKGRVLDVAVDIRKGSPTCGKHVAVELTEDNHRQFLFLRALRMASLCYQRLRYSSISVITSITLRLMGVSLSWMNLSVSMAYCYIRIIDFLRYGKK